MTGYVIDPQLGDVLIIPSRTRYATEQRVRVVKVGRVKFQTVREHDYDAYQQDPERHPYWVTTWRKDTGRTDGTDHRVGSGGPVIRTPEEHDRLVRRGADREYLGQVFGLNGRALDERVIDASTLAGLVREHLKGQGR